MDNNNPVHYCWRRMGRVLSHPASAIGAGAGEAPGHPKQLLSKEQLPLLPGQRWRRGTRKPTSINNSALGYLNPYLVTSFNIIGQFPDVKIVRQGRSHFEKIFVWLPICMIGEQPYQTPVQKFCSDLFFYDHSHFGTFGTFYTEKQKQSSRIFQYCFCFLVDPDKPFCWIAFDFSMIPTNHRSPFSVEFCKQHGSKKQI